MGKAYVIKSFEDHLEKTNTTDNKKPNKKRANREPRSEPVIEKTIAILSKTFEDELSKLGIEQQRRRISKLEPKLSHLFNAAADLAEDNKIEKCKHAIEILQNSKIKIYLVEGYLTISEALSLSPADFKVCINPAADEFLAQKDLSLSEVILKTNEVLKREAQTIQKNVRRGFNQSSSN